MFKKAMLLFMCVAFITPAIRPDSDVMTKAIKDWAYLTLGGVLAGSGIFILKHFDPKNKPNNNFEEAQKQLLKNDAIRTAKNTLGWTSLFLGSCIVVGKCIQIADRLNKE